MNIVAQFSRFNSFRGTTKNQMSVSSVGVIHLTMCEQMDLKHPSIRTEMAFMMQEAGQEHLRMCLVVRELSLACFS